MFTQDYCSYHIRYSYVYVLDDNIIEDINLYMEKENKEKKHKGRFAYLNDFKLNENNEYEYHGNVFKIELSNEEKKKLIIKCIGLHLLLMITILVGGFLPYEAMNGSFYVVVPYAFEFIFSLLILPKMFTVFTKSVLREYEYKKSVDKIRPYYYVIAINAALGFGSCLLYGFLEGFEPILITAIYALSKLLSTILANAA